MVSIQKTSDNSNSSVHFWGVRFICSPYLTIRSTLALLGPKMAKCRAQMNLTPSKRTLLSNYQDVKTDFISGDKFLHKLLFCRSLIFQSISDLIAKMTCLPLSSADKQHNYSGGNGCKCSHTSCYNSYSIRLFPC